MFYNIDDSPQTLASNYFDSNTLCWYKFISSTSDLISFDLNLDYLVRASAEVYLESSTDVFSYIGDLAKQGSMTVKVNYLNAVWVLSVPTGVGAAISITTYWTFTYSEDLGVDTMFVIGVLLIIAAIIIVICTISYFIWRLRIIYK